MKPKGHCVDFSCFLYFPSAFSIFLLTRKALVTEEQSEYALRMIAVGALSLEAPKFD